MKIVFGWLFCCFVGCFLLHRFAHLRGGMAAGVTILLSSLPVLYVLFSTGKTFANGNVGLIGPVFLIAALGCGLVILGLSIILLSFLFRL